MRPRTILSVAVLLLWSLFTWGGRVRNALADEALSDAERGWALLLSASFVLPALVLAIMWWLHSGRTPWTGRSVPTVGNALRLATVVFAAWTIAVWLVRGIDIALFSGHEIGFVVVHSVLALVAIGLAGFAALSLLTDTAVRARADGRP
jgi:hypothetical protein